MKTEVKKISESKKEVWVEVTGEIVKNKFAEVFKKIGQEAHVKGFRPGHAPREILEKNFSQAAHEQVLRELIPDVYKQAVEKEKLEVLELPEISEVKLDRNSLSFKAQVQIRPEIKLKEYQKIKVDYQRISVSPEEVKKNLDALKEVRKIQNLDDRFAKGLGYPDLKELEEAVGRQIYLNKENTQRQKIENQIIEALIKDVDFKLPQLVVDRQRQEMLRQVKLDLALKGVAREKIAEQEKELNAQLEPEAAKQVKIYLILEEVARREKIALDEHMPKEVMEFLLREADWQEKT